MYVPQHQMDTKHMFFIIKHFTWNQNNKTLTRCAVNTTVLTISLAVSHGHIVYCLAIKSFSLCNSFCPADGAVSQAHYLVHMKTLSFLKSY